MRDEDEYEDEEKEEQKEEEYKQENEQEEEEEEEEDEEEDEEERGMACETGGSREGMLLRPMPSIQGLACKSRKKKHMRRIPEKRNHVHSLGDHNAHHEKRHELYVQQGGA